MADVSDVQQVLVDLVAGILYPSGTGAPPAPGVGVRIYPGWPDSSQIQADLQAQPPICHVSVWATPQERNTTRYPRRQRAGVIRTPTLALTIAGQVVTVSGTPPDAANPHNLMVLVNGTPYVYRVLVGDTLVSIALALATLIAVDVPGTTPSGATIVMPASARVQAARVGVTGDLVREVARQERVFQLSVWADSPAHRDAIAQLINPVLQDATRIVLPDNTFGRLQFSRSTVVDGLQKEGAYRRDLFFSVDYGTTVTSTATQITQPQMTTAVAVAGVPPYETVNTITF